MNPNRHGTEGRGTDPDLALTEFLKAELLSLRKDVESMVGQEVKRVGLPKERAESLVRDMAKQALEELGVRPSLFGSMRLAAPRPRDREEYHDPDASGFALSGRMLLRASLVLIALAGVFHGGRLYERRQVPPADRTATRPPPETRMVQEAPLVAGTTDEARYDSLFAARAPVVQELVDALELQNVDPVLRTAIQAWRNGTATAAQKDRVHVGLLQSVLREWEPSLSLDGLMTRQPCGGNTCGALLRAAAERPDWEIPPLEAIPTDSAVRAAEKRIVYHRVLERSR